ISGVTSICRPCRRSASRSSSIVTPAPTAIVPWAGAPICLNRWVNTSVPCVVKDGLSECKEPAARTGEGYVSRSVTTRRSSSVVAGDTTCAGSQRAESFQFLIAIAGDVMASWCRSSATDGCAGARALGCQNRYRRGPLRRRGAVPRLDLERNHDDRSVGRERDGDDPADGAEGVPEQQPTGRDDDEADDIGGERPERTSGSHRGVVEAQAEPEQSVRQPHGPEIHAGRRENGRVGCEQASPEALTSRRHAAH